MAHLLRRAAQRTKELEPNGIDTLTFTLVKSSAIPATEKREVHLPCQTTVFIDLPCNAPFLHYNVVHASLSG